MTKLFDEIKKHLPEGKEITLEIIKAAATKISEAGKFVPEAKYLELKKANKTLTDEKSELETKVAEFKEINPEDAKTALEELAKLKEKQKQDAEAATIKAEKEKAAAHNDSIKAAMIAKLKEAGAIDAELVVEKAIAKAGGADKIELNEKNEITTDIDFAINHVKTAHATNFTKEHVEGGANGAGAGGAGASAWTPESAKAKRTELSDQEAIDLAKEDSEFAKNAGLSSYTTSEEA